MFKPAPSSNSKAASAERFIRKVKERIWRYFTHKLLIDILMFYKKSSSRTTTRASQQPEWPPLPLHWKTLQSFEGIRRGDTLAQTNVSLSTSLETQLGSVEPRTCLRKGTRAGGLWSCSKSFKSRRNANLSYITFKIFLG